MPIWSAAQVDRIRREMKGSAGMSTSTNTSTSTQNRPAAEKIYVNAAYYPNWMVYQDKPPSYLNINFISHVYYAFALPKSDGLVELSDAWADRDKQVDGAQGAIRALKKLAGERPGSKPRIILSIGGGGAGSANFAAAASTADTRRQFAESALGLVNTFGLDGIDIDWEHPSNSEQGKNYLDLLAALRQKLPSPQYLITSALPAGQWALQHVNLAQAAQYLDLINLMAYDFTGSWTEISGHHANLHSSRHSPTSVHDAINYMLSNQVPAAKIVLGIPVYGRSFLGSEKSGQRHAGCGGQEGTFLYSDLPRPGTQEKVDTSACAAYCVGGDGGFVTYDSALTVRMKAEYVKDKGLAGLFYWTGTGDVRGPRSLVEAGYNGLHD